MDRRIDELGRVVIPSHMRRAVGFETKTPIKFEVVDGGVLLSKASNTCVICNDDKNLTPVKDKWICDKCKAMLK